MGPGVLRCNVGVCQLTAAVLEIASGWDNGARRFSFDGSGECTTAHGKKQDADLQVRLLLPVRRIGAMGVFSEATTDRCEAGILLVGE
jgi:hypothetical protein